jgi:hypothetical protein
MPELNRDDDGDNAVTSSLVPDAAPLKRRRVVVDASLVVGIGRTKESVELAAEKPNEKTSVEDGSDKTMVQGAVCSSMVDTRDHTPCDQSHPGMGNLLSRATTFRRLCTKYRLKSNCGWRARRAEMTLALAAT